MLSNNMTKILNKHQKLATELGIYSNFAVVGRETWKQINKKQKKPKLK